MSSLYEYRKIPALHMERKKGIVFGVGTGRKLGSIYHLIGGVCKGMIIRI